MKPPSFWLRYSWFWLVWGVGFASYDIAERIWWSVPMMAGITTFNVWIARRNYRHRLRRWQRDMRAQIAQRIRELERRPPPPHCTECMLADMTRWQQRRYRKAQSSNPMALYSGLFVNQMFGAEPSMYERHRDNWLQTGDVMELDRMKRHVSRYS